MATYEEIQDFVASKYGFTPETCWIAHVKDMVGLPVRRAWNRKGDEREKPCPPERVEPIKDAMRHSGMIR